MSKSTGGSEDASAPGPGSPSAAPGTPASPSADPGSARSTPASARGTLNAEHIAQATLALGDRDGAAAMSMRRIAADLGCDPMALYRHFPNRTALLDAVADLVLAEVDLPDPAARWDRRVAVLLTRMRAAAVRHPGITAHIASRPPLGANGLRAGAVLIGAFTDAGLTPRDVVRATQLMVAYLSNALAMAAATGGAPDARWQQVADALATPIPTGTDLPTADLPPTGSLEQFTYGLEVLLTGLDPSTIREG
ncbi:TetR/AcrR family transcriptional regulator [Millisia brevis]|uniref:TetR/AcrR family transcriptional regulator n=1 Tax=Millisia brevis TaxID=264148 RepID=UPI0012EDA61C|nr:TetR/AcrR family transcriptional regulator [Millisia brevis]